MKAIFEYKCRRCGEIWPAEGMHIVDANRALPEIINPGPRQWKVYPGGMTPCVILRQTHQCRDGVGIADLIGYRTEG